MPPPRPLVLAVLGVVVVVAASGLAVQHFRGKPDGRCNAVLAQREALLNQPTPPADVTVVLGDSWSVGSGTANPGTDAWPVALSRVIGRPVIVDGMGSTGYVTRGVCPGRPVAYPDRVSTVLALRPETVVIEGGLNDAIRGVPPAHVQAAAGQLLRRLKDVRNVVVVGAPAPPQVTNTIGPVDAALEAAARAAGRVFVPTLDLRLTYPDGLHPDTAGAAAFAAAVAGRAGLTARSQ